MLYLWMPEADGAWHWSKGDNWITAASMEQLIQDLQPYQGEEAVVYFPSHEVQVIQQAMSKTQYKQLGTEGVKYLLEEYIIHPIDHMKVLSHFQAPDQLYILGISQHAAITMQHSLSLIPVKLTALLPDYLLLPNPEPGQLLIANIHGRLLTRQNDFQGQAVDDLNVFLELTARPELYVFDGLTDEQLTSLLNVSTQEQRARFDYVFRPDVKFSKHPFNILPKAKNNAEGISGYWKACAAVFVTVLLVQLSYDLVRWVKLKHVADQTAQLALDQYQSWFGPSSRLNEQNLRSQFESNLRLNKPANMQVLQLLSRVGPLLMQNQIIANRIHYDEAGLNMDLVGRNADSLQQLVQQMNQQGFKAELGNVQTLDSQVIGLVKVQ